MTLVTPASTVVSDEDIARMLCEMKDRVVLPFKKRFKPLKKRSMRKPFVPPNKKKQGAKPRMLAKRNLSREFEQAVGSSVGRRVVVLWLPEFASAKPRNSDLRAYPGTVVAEEGGKSKVAYDDGTEAWHAPTGKDKDLFFFMG